MVSNGKAELGFVGFKLYDNIRVLAGRMITFDNIMMANVGILARLEAVIIVESVVVNGGLEYYKNTTSDYLNR